jgi:hypothetical protein
MIVYKKLTAEAEAERLEEAYFKLKCRLEEVSSLPWDQKNQWSETFLKRKLMECQAMLVLTEVDKW